MRIVTKTNSMLSLHRLVAVLVALLPSTACQEARIINNGGGLSEIPPPSSLPPQPPPPPSLPQQGLVGGGGSPQGLVGGGGSPQGLVGGGGSPQGLVGGGGGGGRRPNGAPRLLPGSDLEGFALAENSAPGTKVYTLRYVLYSAKS
jgi:hypothetical protein